MYKYGIFVFFFCADIEADGGLIVITHILFGERRVKNNFREGKIWENHKNLFFVI